MDEYKCPKCKEKDFEIKDQIDEGCMIVKYCYCNKCDIMIRIEYIIDEIEIDE